MHPEARVLWQALEFRTPAMMSCLARLTEAQMSWQPPNGANSAAWLLWHIAEVEDNWIRDKVLGEAKEYPFGTSVKAVDRKEYPSKSALLDYFQRVRASSRERLERMTPAELERPVHDEHFGLIDVRGVWIGVATSCSWHGGQIALLANRLIPAGGEGA
jgi:hypothetical protein